MSRVAKTFYLTTCRRSNDAYAWTAHANVDRTYTTNGLNQYTQAGTVGFTYDARGNLITSGSNSYGYSAENRLISGPGGVALSYDALGRLRQTGGGAAGVAKFLYDGSDLIAELSSGNGMLRRYVHGPGVRELFDAGRQRIQRPDQAWPKGSGQNRFCDQFAID